MHNSLTAVFSRCGLAITISGITFLAILLQTHAVSSQQTSNTAVTGQAKVPYKHTGKEATLSGRVLFVGEPPTPKVIDTSADPSCEKANPRLKTEDVVIKEGMIANVFVYVKGSALDTLSFETPDSPVFLDQRGCRFAPHVIGVQTGQTLMITNSDPTHHNIHPTPKNNAEWNQTQPSEAPPIIKQFPRPELLIPIKCNQHPWMKAYAGVLPHPFFAVSDDSGFYRIEGLPPGNYTIVAWHEKFGEQTAEITIAPYERRSLDFAFENSQKGSLKTIEFD